MSNSVATQHSLNPLGFSSAFAAPSFDGAKVLSFRGVVRKPYVNPTKKVPHSACDTFNLQTNKYFVQTDLYYLLSYYTDFEHYF